MNWPFRRKNPARELALIGVEKRRERVLETARRIREEIGMPPSPLLEGRR